MNKIYEKGVTRNQQASSHTLSLLMSMLRVWLEYGWSMARVWLGAAKEQQRSSIEAAWSMVKVCLRYAYAIPTRFLRPFSSKRAELERRLVGHEITAHSQRDYSSSLTRLRLVMSLLLMLTLGSGSVWGQEGVWYIANDNTSSGHPGKAYSSASDTEKYYLVPAANPQQTNAIDAYYSPNHNTNNGDPEKPFLATALTNKDLNSIWIVKKSEESGCYFIIHALTGKYAVYEVPLPNDPSKNTDTDETKNGKRKTMHLQTIDNGDYNPSANDNFKFVITTSGDGYNIRPKRRTGWYWNPAGQNNDVYYGQSSGENPNLYRNGLVGVYNNTGTNSIWHFEDASSATTLTPVISDVNGADNTFTITSPAAAFSTIYYTTDGSTTPNATTGTIVISGSPITITENWSVQAVGVFNSFCTPVAGPKDLAPLGCAKPVITYDYTTSNVSISCSTPSSTIYYTTDGSTPTTSSTQYSAPFSVGSPTTVKAIATHATLPSSIVAELAITQVATPTIQNDGSNAISITTTTPDATIYYTTDGTDPTTASTEYTGPLTDNVSNVTIKAIAVKEGMITSAVGSGLVKLQCATPVIAKVGLTFTLSCSLPTDATLYYTINGGSETLYNGPVPFTADQLPMTVAAVARHSNYTESETASMEIKKGEGTPDDPYIIYDTTDFTSFITNVNNGTAASACYKLGSDISANGTAAITASYGGIFDGNGYTISDLSHPLFNIVDGGVVKNVTLKNVGISSSDSYVGAIAGTAQGYSRIYNCGILPNDATFPEGTHPYVTTTGTGAGGIVGLLKDDSRVINCYSYADVSAATRAAGIVGQNTYTSTATVTDGKYADLRTAVVNCMFYGNITGGTNQHGVYGGELITNATATGISSYNYYRNGTTFSTSNGRPTAYNCSFPAEERYLTQVEFHRSLLNSNRELCGWWVGSDVAPSTLTTAQVQAIPKDASLMYKWVVDPNIAPYPILKPFGKYASVINGNTGTPWVNRATANPYEGKQLGTLTVKVNAGSNFSGSKTLYIPITDMDTLRYDFGYRKIQLPYYNTEFGNPNSDDWNTRYANNYTDKVVTGWKVTSVKTDGTIETYNEFVADWQDGYNFADRKCIDKDIYSGTNPRVFAQGGNYYVPDGVTEITIEAYWGKAIYVRNDENSYDRVNITLANTGSHFAPAGTRGDNINGATVKTSIRGALATIDAKKTVYDYALVLVGNVQESVGKNDVKYSGSDYRGFTIMSVDLDFDEEPDYCLEWQLGDNMARQVIAPIRFDFIPVVELGIAGKRNGSTNFYSLGCYRSQGHFEVTETSFIRFGQFEFELGTRDEGPIILNGGIYDQYCRGRNGETTQNINYVILGGHVVMPSFTPGAHVNEAALYQTRHCAVNALGGDFTSFYLTGGYNEAIEPYEDNPHCYIDGGRFGTIAAAYKEGIWGDVTWRINHALIGEFYGGGVMAQKDGATYKIVKGNINVVIDNSIVSKYCGGPKFGDMVDGKTVTTSATGTTFNQYFGAGNGGTNYVQYKSTDTTGSPVSDWSGTINSNYHPATYRNTAQGYEADYDIEVINPSTGDKAGSVVNRSYYYSAQFATTNTGNVTSELTDCTINTNFYGGGFLGGVTGNVTSTLNNCTVKGAVFGAGYSASAGTVSISNIDKTPPVVNTYTGMIKPQTGGTSTTYYWTHDKGSTSSPITAATEADPKNYFYTEIPLDNLGTVSGNVTLTINGVTTTVGESVYGGGEESVVNGNTTVTVTGGTIGTTGKGGAEYGNVYGGGKGKEDDVTAGIVKGSTTVSISGSPAILHNVYGGGAYGSVGTFSYDATGFPTGWTTTDNKGKCTVSITGGTIGTTGDNNGMVFGSSRGLEGNPETNTNVDKMAWVYDTDVTIGTQSSETGPSVKGSVYGGGENGHNFHDAKVTVHSGTIGIPEGSAIVNDGGTPDDTSDDISYSGARFPNRGNVYGSGCGTDTYIGTDSKTYFDFNAGIVRGNTTVLIKGGHVVHNVYGGGAMGSVGTYTFDANGKPISCADGTGTCTVTVSGGQIGVAGAKMAGYGKAGPDDYGHVFGAGRGEMHDPDQYPNVETCAFFNKTVLTISGMAFLTGSAYGGSESGHVLGDTEVTISGGQIGCGKNALEPYGTDVWADDYTPTGSVTESMDCASWPFTAPFAPYDPFANATGDLDQYPNGESTDGGRLEASDGHTYYGNVFGGGSGSVPYFDTTDGISKYLSTAGSVEGKTTINITGGHIITNVYGGCEATNVKGSATITMTGGTVGVPRTVAQIIAHPNTGYIFGAGKGDQRIFFNKETNVDRTEVNIEGGRVYGSIFGGGEDGHVFQNAIVNIGKENDDTEGPTIGTWGTSYVDGNVFGGGRGFGGEALTAGNIGGSIELNIKSGKILGSVYGGGRMGSVGYGLYLVDEEIEEGGETIKPYGILRPNDKYDGSYPDPSTEPASTYYDKGRGYIVINITGGTIGNDYEYIYNPTDEQKAAIPKTTFDYQNHLQYTKGGNVFTGGMGRLYALDNTTLLPLWSKLGKCKGTTLNMTGGTVKSSIYGGGEIGAVAENATVNVNGGTVGTKVVNPEDATKYYYFGSVFGGGKGNTDAITYPDGTAEADKIPISEAGTTGGNVTVNLNKDVAENKPGAIVNQVFGCNDMNGSPKGDVTVHIYATQTAGKANISTKPDKNNETFDVDAVYGGGNLAAYKPDGGKNTTKVAKVIIDGCGLTSIETVYGGGNAASTPATEVTVNGTYEIYEMFGGGNGKDKLPNGAANPGANVGFYDYSAVEATYDTKEKRQTENFTKDYIYGTGKATVNIFGGMVHRVFGGSNTKGNVRQTALTLLDENSGCDFCVDEAYGGGKSAEMDAEAKLLMACIPGLDAVYGGAEAADVHGDVTLNITNGTFQRVFGGNNLSGTIGGAIKVNIEEVGCKPIVIGELYGGGNQAGYSIYGYDGVDANGKAILKENGSNPWADPEVNVISFTSIGEIYGGGFGADAVMVGSPKVNINEAVGTPDTYTGVNFDANKFNGRTFTIDEGEPTEHTVTCPAHEKGKMGAIGNVFGGGNAAQVKGNTQVNIGTAVGEITYEEVNVEVGTTVVTSYYIRTGAGTSESPYTYTDHPSVDAGTCDASGKAVTGQTYYRKVEIIGADIRGNVYGGGNNAQVTGNTNVNIGKKEGN